MSENAREDLSPDEDVETKAEYEAPEIEQIVTAENLEREVQYAGFSSPAP